MRVGVVGSGIAGLGAARALVAAGAQVTLLEAAPRLGGHARTVTVPGARGPVAVDVGFIVCNRDTYPRFFQLLDTLGVRTQPTSMAFSVAAPDDDLEWGSAGLRAMFADPRLLGRARHWRLLLEVFRFLRRARRDDASGATVGRSLDEYLAQTRTPADVRAHFVVPLAAALWSLAPARCGEFPAETYVAFLRQHGMLNPGRQLDWHTIVGGSGAYVAAVERALRAGGAEIVVGQPVRAIQRRSGGVAIELDGGARVVDRVVLATHADVALALLGDASDQERSALGAFSYSPNLTVLHRDTAVMPQRRAAWASWNYRRVPGPTGDAEVAVTYWMNALQALPDEQPLLVTLNPRAPIAPHLTLHTEHFRHPQFHRAALRAQAEIGALQGQRRTYFAGAHLGYGFHEDGLRAGELAAGRLLADAGGRGPA
jgi:predicted NAD/FAD-binding protein